MSTTAKNEKPIVHLRVYKGATMAYDANGNVLNPNQSVKLKYNTLEWHNFLKRLPSMGFSFVKVEKTLSSIKKGEDGKELEVEIPKEILDAVAAVFKKEEKELSAEQKELAELRQKNSELESKNKSFEDRLKTLELGKNKTQSKDVATPTVDPEMEELKAKYKTLSGKDAHRLVGKEKLRNDIEALENAKK